MGGLQTHGLAQGGNGELREVQPPQLHAVHEETVAVKLPRQLPRQLQLLHLLTKLLEGGHLHVVG